MLRYHFIWSVKSELLRLKIASRVHHNTLFQDKNLKNFLGRGTAHPLGASIVAPSALHTSRFRRLVLCVPYFQCRLLATLMWLISSRVNEVNGENLQDPPIKNPGYANGPPTGAHRCVMLNYKRASCTFIKCLSASSASWLVATLPGRFSTDSRYSQ